MGVPRTCEDCDASPLFVVMDRSEGLVPYNRLIAEINAKLGFKVSVLCHEALPEAALWSSPET